MSNIYFEDFYLYIILRRKSLGIVSVPRLGEISKPPTNKELAFVIVPFSFMHDDVTTTLLHHLAHVQKRKQTCHTQPQNIREKDK